jgi:transcriptional regulator with XRE-family HTH domain
MSARNILLEAPPLEVEQALKTLGANLRLARLRRNLSLSEIAEKIGAGRRVVADAESGKPSTGVAVYVALLWALGLVEQLIDVADPARDTQGMTLSLARERSRGGRRPVADNDF